MNLLSIYGENISFEINLGNPNVENNELCFGVHVTKCNIEDTYYDELENNITRYFHGTRLCIGLLFFNIVIALKNEEVDELEL